jgi:hypothetical protein
VTGPDITRINVAVTPEQVAAARRLMEREDVNLSEAVRRLMIWGDQVYETIALNDGVVTLDDRFGERIMMILAKRDDDVGDLTL